EKEGSGGGQNPGPDKANLMSVFAFLSAGGEKGVLRRSWLRRALWALSAAALWVAMEMALARIFGGFPWALLGGSQYRMIPLIQIASVTGVYGVSFVVVWVSLALLSAGLMVIRRPATRSVWIAEIFVPITVVAVLFNLGFRQIREEQPTSRTLKVALVQPSIPQTLIWDPEGDTHRFDELLRITEQALSKPTDVVIWPESAVPKMLRYDTNTFDAVSELARRHKVWMIVGSDDAEPRRSAKEQAEADYFNSSFLVSPQGKLMERYIKRNLVIFGEYVPLQHWLPFLQYFTPTQGGFTPGTGPIGFELTALDVHTTVLICFEDIFPHLARSDVSPETDFLVNITNDGWFGESAAHWQHAVAASIRTVETRLPLIRCSNNGITCWIDRYGRFRQVFTDEHGSAYGKGYLNVEIPLLAPGEDHELTFYSRHGDWFGWGCVMIGGLVLVRRLVAKRFKSTW
ncbi:MAG TPA: apolipoprotein N-acyltransferase, partial [Clostridia bacterium]|nr:apolipoprotein N-acyltransferase [Clostridia bacterium]